VNENRTSSGPNVGLLLLIPAAAIVARMAVRHHQVAWDGGGAPDGGPRLPPRIEWALNRWHARAHKAAEPTGAVAAVEAPSA